MVRGRSCWQCLAYGLPALFILAPLLSFLAYSFFHMENGQIVRDLSLTNYRRFFTDAIFLPVLWQTCLLCLGVAALTILFGYPVALFLATLKGRRRHFLLLMVLVPLLMSYIIKIYAIRSILGGKGLLNQFLQWSGITSEPLTIFVFNLNAVLLSLTVLLIPFAILPIFLSLERIPRDLIEASADLGGSGPPDLHPHHPAPQPPGVVTAGNLRLRPGDRRLPHAADGRRPERLHLRAHRLQPVRDSLQLAFRRSACGHPRRSSSLASYRSATAWSAVADDAAFPVATAILSAITCLVFALLYGPLLIPIASSLFTVSHGDVQWNTPSLSAYAALAANDGILTAIGNTPDRRLLCDSAVAGGGHASGDPLLRRQVDRPGSHAVRGLSAIPHAAHHHRASLS